MFLIKRKLEKNTYCFYKMFSNKNLFLSLKKKIQKEIWPFYQSYKKKKLKFFFN